MPPPNPYGKEGKTARCHFILYHCYITQDFLNKGLMITIMLIVQFSPLRIFISHHSPFYVHTCTCIHTHTHTYFQMSNYFDHFLFGCFPLNNHFEIFMFMVSTTMNSIQGSSVMNKFIMPMSSLKKNMISWYCSKKIDPSIPLESELLYIQVQYNTAWDFALRVKC